MAEKKLPWNVRRIGADGRRYFTKEFIEGVVNDIVSGRATRAGVSKEHKLPSSLVSQWVLRAQGQGYKQSLKRTIRSGVSRLPELPVTDASGSSLLERARAAGPGSPSTSDAVFESIAQQVELAQAYLKGDVNELQVRIALDKRSGKFMVTNWLGHVFVGALRSGWRLVRESN